MNGISNLSRAKYDRLEAVNWSSLKHMLRSPAHYRYALLTEQKDTDAMKLGRATHLACFEPERFRKEVAVWDGGARRGKDWDAFTRDNRGLELLTSNQAELARAIGEAARARAGTLLAQGDAEMTLQWTHPNELPGKGRIDFLSAEHGIIDLKTCRDASPQAFGGAAARMLYHAQAAYYVDGLHLATGKRVPYTIVAVETTPPFVSGIYTLSDDQILLGAEIYEPLLDLLKSCREQNHFPGYVEQQLVLPKWAQPSDEEDDGSGLTFGSSTEAGVF